MTARKQVSIGFRLDTRRAKKDGTYPVKLEIYHNYRKRRYSTGIDLTKEEFEKTWNRNKPKKAYKTKRDQLDALYFQAKEIIEQFNDFSFDAFESQFLETPDGKGHDIFSLYDKKIKDLKQAGRQGSADSYHCSIKAIKNYLQFKRGKLPKSLSFENITPNFLEDFEKYITETRNLSISTVGIYTRHLRAIFNDAIEAGITTNYPFGRRKYKTPAAKKTKKALDFDELKKLNQAEPKNSEQEKAKDFWLLSFCLYGINVKDLVSIRNKDLTQSHLTFYRTKTLKTSKENLTPISIPITEKAREIIEKYRSPNVDPDEFVFDVINEADDPSTKQQKVHNFTRFINQHIKALADVHDLPRAISYQWARHTFATLSVRQGASLEFVSEALGHHNLNTTQAYFAGFDKDTGKEIMERLTNF